jgi:isochorismate synthase
VFAEDLEKAQSLIASLTNQKPIPNKTGQTKMISRMDQVTWKNSLSEALKAIANGEMSKVVVARVLELRSSLNIPAEQALALLQTQYPSTYQIGLSPKDGSHLISASPERLVRIANGQLETMALAGTFPRGEEQIDPAAITKSMMANPKERQEHEIVRSEIMGQLRPFCRDLDIAPEPGIRELPNVFHLHSLIHGKLRSGQHILDIVETLHPTPALGGRPRDAALDLIARVETQSRGWYGAPIGYFDNQGEGDFAVAIRSAVVRDQRAWLYAGAGIVTGSSPTKEWEETNAKLLPMLDAFEVGI